MNIFKNLIVLVLFVTSVCLCAKNTDTIYIENTVYTTEDTLVARLLASECYLLSDELDAYRMASLVYNRLNQPCFPNDIESVIFERGQFDGPVHNKKAFYSNINLTALYIANSIRTSGAILAPEIVGVFNPKTSTDSKWVNRIITNKYVKVKGKYHWYHELPCR